MHTYLFTHENDFTIVSDVVVGLWCYEYVVH